MLRNLARYKLLLILLPFAIDLCRHASALRDRRGYFAAQYCMLVYPYVLEMLAHPRFWDYEMHSRTHSRFMNKKISRFQRITVFSVLSPFLLFWCSQLLGRFAHHVSRRGSMYYDVARAGRKYTIMRDHLEDVPGNQDTFLDTFAYARGHYS